MKYIKQDNYIINKILILLILLAVIVSTFCSYDNKQIVYADSNNVSIKFYIQTEYLGTNYTFVSEISILSGTVLQEDDIPNVEEYETSNTMFFEWRYFTAEGVGEIFDFTLPVNEDIELASLQEDARTLEFYEDNSYNNLICSLKVPCGSYLDISLIPEIEHPEGSVYYSFAYWDFDASSSLGQDTWEQIMHSCQYYPKYNKNFMDISFRNNNNVTFQTVRVLYSYRYLSLEQIPNPPSVEGYDFLHWKNTVTNNIYTSEELTSLLITSNSYFRAIYEEAIYYTLTFFESGTENILLELEKKEGSYLNDGEYLYDILRDGYTYTTQYDISWNTSMPILSDIVITVTYNIISYQVKFTNPDGSTYHTLTKNHGETLTLDDLPQGPAKSDDNNYYYEFSHWQGSKDVGGSYELGTEISSDLSFTPFYNEITKCRVFFKDTDNNLISFLEKPINSYITEDEIPIAPKIEGQVFDRWFASAGGYLDLNNKVRYTTMEYQAQYTDEYYVIIFNDHENNLISQTGVIQGRTIHNYDIPSYNDTYRSYYNFVGWESSIEGYNITSIIDCDLIFTALYEIAQATIIFQDIQTDFRVEIQKDYLTTLTSEDIPTPEREHFALAFWESLTPELYDINSQIIYDNILFNAIWERTEYKITFYIMGESSYIYKAKDSVLTSEDIPATPEYEDYEFIHWIAQSTEYDLTTPINADMFFVAGYLEYFDIKFLDYDGNVIYQVEKLEGTYLLDEEIPILAEHELYIFINWYGLADGYNYYVDNQIFRDVTFAPDAEERTLIDIEISYYTIERLYYTKQNYFLWVIPTDQEYKFMDFLVYKSINYSVSEGLVPDINELVGTALYGVSAHQNVSGFEFLEWDNGTEDLLPTIENNHYTAVYNIPQVEIEYYGANGKYVETTKIDVNFVPLPEIQNNLDWFEAFIKYFQDIIIKWDFIEFADDLEARNKALEAVNYLSSRYEFGSYEPIFMVAQPNVNVDYAYGIFKGASAGVSSGTFKYLMGTSHNNNYVYYADLSGIYITGIRYAMRVTFDTPYDAVIDVVSNVYNGVTGVFSWFADNWYVALAFLVCVLLFIVAFKQLKKESA